MVDCPRCDDADIEWVEVRSNAEIDTVETTQEELGNGLLQLLWCNNCSTGIERVLTEESRHVVP